MRAWDYTGPTVTNGMALCAGAGGLELALRIALGDDYRCVVYVEREAYAATTLVARMADAAVDTAPVWDDITTFDGKPWRGVVDLVSAGFSCQPWSSAGKRLGIEDERWLWPDIDRVVREVGPEWVFLENVPGLVHGGIEHVLGSLAAQGFNAEWDCVSASEVGATQLRQRLYLLARATRGGRRVVRQSSGRRGQPDGNRQAVADSDTAGFDGLGSVLLPGNAEILAASAAGADAPAASRSYWPPDRSYAGEWPNGFEPAVRRVADGMAPWVDRLRLTGNGVVPLAAAVAFIRLRARLVR